MPVLYYESDPNAYTEAEKAAGRGDSGPVNEQHPLPVQLTWLSEGEDEWGGIEVGHPLPVQVTPGSPRESVAGAQYGLSIGAAVVRLTVPPDAQAGEIYVRTASIVFTRDGTDPTATQGFQADASDIIMLNSRNELEKFEAIRQGGVSATGDVEYFTKVAG